MVRSIYLGLALTMFAVWPVWAQSDLDSFSDVIDVRLINLEIAVTDRDGEFVPGLGPQDFRLLVDGEELPIEYFTEVRDGRARAVVATGGDDEKTAAVRAVPNVAPGEIVGTSYLLFIDNFFGHERDRRIVLEGLIDEIQAFGPEDRMAVVTFDGDRLEMLSSWTKSQQELTAVLRKAMTQPASGIQRRAELSRFSLQYRNLNTGLIRESNLNLINGYVRTLSQQVNKIVNAAITTMRSFAMPPGRKVMLLSSGGWPREPSTYVAGLNPEVRNRALKWSPVWALEDLASTANLLGYTIYPIDLPGRQVRMPGADDAEGLQTEPAAPITGDGTENMAEIGEVEAPDPIPVNTNEQEFEMESSLLVLAEQTGGQAMINGLRQTAMGRVRQDTGSYYWIGFTPRLRRDDEEHEVEVEVRREGVKTRSRQGFKDLSRQTEVTMAVESHLLFSSHLGGRPLEVKLGKKRKKRRGRFDQPVSLTIPLDEVTMLPHQGEFRALLELRVIALDEANEKSNVSPIPIAFGGPEPPPGAFATYDTVIQLRDTTRRMVLALYDLVGEKILITTIQFDLESD